MTMNTTAMIIRGWRSTQDPYDDDDNNKDDGHDDEGVTEYMILMMMMMMIMKTTAMMMRGWQSTNDPYDDDDDVGDCDQRVLPGGGGGNVGHQPRHLLQVRTKRFSLKGIVAQDKYF